LRLFILLKMGAGSSVRRPAAPAKAAMAAIAINDETIENIRKKEDQLQRKIGAEFANAQKFHAAGKKREARQCIQKKKMYEQQLTTLGTCKMNLENQKLTTDYTEGEVEAALRNYEAFHGRPFGSATVEDLQSSSAEIGGWLLAGPHFAKLSRLWRAAPTAVLSRGPGRKHGGGGGGGGGGGADKVEELMDELEDLRTPTSDLMLQYGIDADDDELRAELDRMEEEMAADSSKKEELVMIARNPAKEAMAKLKETIENIRKKEDHLQRKIDAELATAEKFDAAGEKLEALQCLEKRKMYEQQLATLGTCKMNLENQKLIMESIQRAAKSLQEQVKQMGGVDKV
jgi:tetratricopeptide (TPR) repeat protein